MHFYSYIFNYLPIGLIILGIVLLDKNKKLEKSKALPIVIIVTGIIFQLSLVVLPIVFPL